MRSPTSSVRGYDAGAMLLHWVVAALIVLQIAGGFALERTDVLPAALRFPAIQWHKTFGLLILTLTLARIAWRLINPPPEGAPMSTPERLLAGLIHFLFYALMVAVPLSGWLMVSASPRQIPTLLFLSSSLPFVHLPVPSAVREAIEGVAVNAHTLLGYSFVALLFLHVAGALKHSVVDRAPSFSRMLPDGRLHRRRVRPLAVPVAFALAAAFIVAGVAAGRREHSDAAVAAEASSAPAPPAPASAGNWRIDKAASRLSFEIAFSGKTVAGTIGNWNASIVFDPAGLGAGTARIEIDPTSVAVEEPFVQSSVPGPDGFDTANHPQAVVALDRFETTPNGFLGHGTATIRGKSLAIDVPFAFMPESGGRAHVVGSAVLDRLAFGLGVVNDPTGQFLGKDVTVRFDLSAARA